MEFEKTIFFFDNRTTNVFSTWWKKKKTFDARFSEKINCTSENLQTMEDVLDLQFVQRLIHRDRQLTLVNVLWTAMKFIGYFNCVSKNRHGFYIYIYKTHTHRVTMDIANIYNTIVIRKVYIYIFHVHS